MHVPSGLDTLLGGAYVFLFFFRQVETRNEYDSLRSGRSVALHSELKKQTLETARADHDPFDLHMPRGAQPCDATSTLACHVCSHADRQEACVHAGRGNVVGNPQYCRWLVRWACERQLSVCANRRTAQDDVTYGVDSRPIYRACAHGVIMHGDALQTVLVCSCGSLCVCVCSLRMQYVRLYMS